MIIVISDTELFAGEANIVNQLFDNGLQLFHLRKYNNSQSEIECFIDQIKPEYRKRLVLHQFHEMVGGFGIRRLHFSERDRKLIDEVDLKELKNQGGILSTSLHSMDEFNVLSSCFDYAFLSPVFDSISKSDYKAKPFDLSFKKGTNIKLIALGGINENNCSRALEMGFDGVALLGSVWRSEDKTSIFIKVKSELQQAHSY